MVINLMYSYIYVYIYIHIHTYIGVCANPCTVWMTRMRRADGGGGAEKPESDGPALEHSNPMARWPNGHGKTQGWPKINGGTPNHPF